jgi:hypothetical protein
MKVTKMKSELNISGTLLMTWLLSVLICYPFTFPSPLLILQSHYEALLISDACTTVSYSHQVTSQIWYMRDMTSHDNAFLLPYACAVISAARAVAFTHCFTSAQTSCYVTSVIFCRPGIKYYKLRKGKLACTCLGRSGVDWVTEDAASGHTPCSWKLQLACQEELQQFLWQCFFSGRLE